MLKFIFFHVAREADTVPHVHKCCSKDCSSWRNGMNWAGRHWCRVHWYQVLFSLVNGVIYKYSKLHCLTEVISHAVRWPSNWNVLWIFALKLAILTWCFSSLSSGKWCHSTLKYAPVTLGDPNPLCHTWFCSTHWKSLCMPWNPHLMLLNLSFPSFNVQFHWPPKSLILVFNYLHIRFLSV